MGHVVIDRPEISVVIPCLNEERAIGAVVNEAFEGIRKSGRSGEVIVVDNGSADRSAEIAQSHGACVVAELRRGYGAAYLAGLARARGTYIVMADGDGTYPISELAAFVEMLEHDADVVIGSRFDGRIHEGAMPALNRYVGNPVLTGMLNVLFGIKASDAHCGMRAVRGEALPVLDLKALGMEFASEMVFKAYRRGLRVSEIPIDYYPRKGESKLHPVTDGLRHVALMLLYSPNWLYLMPAIGLLAFGALGTLTLAAGPTTIFGRAWNIHALLILIGFTLVGAQILELWVFSRTYAAKHLGEPDPLGKRLEASLTLGRGVLLGSLLSLVGCVVLAWVGVPWVAGGFGELRQGPTVGLGVLLLLLGVQLVFGSFFLALLTLQSGGDTRAAIAEHTAVDTVRDVARDDIA